MHTCKSTHRVQHAIRKKLEFKPGVHYLHPRPAFSLVQL